MFKCLMAVSIDLLTLQTHWVSPWSSPHGILSNRKQSCIAPSLKSTKQQDFSIIFNVYSEAPPLLNLGRLPIYFWASWEFQLQVSHSSLGSSIKWEPQTSFKPPLYTRANDWSLSYTRRSPGILRFPWSRCVPQFENKFAVSRKESSWGGSGWIVSVRARRPWEPGFVYRPPPQDEIF